jgi:hypothetical protein
MRLASALLAMLLACAALARAGEPAVDERVVQLRSERTALQTRADAAARVAFLAPLQLAGLLTDALAARAGLDRRPLSELAAPRREAFAALAALNEALKQAVARPAEATQAQARAAADRATRALEALAGDDQPLLLQVKPRVVPPRRSGELAIAPRESPASAAEVPLRLRPAAPRSAEPPASDVRYAPDFATGAERDAVVAIEIVGLRLGSDGPATLTVGAWRGEAKVAPERLHFSVPRAAFESDATRAVLTSGLLALRRDGRLVTFELPFLVLPDRPGSVALDQKLRWTEPEFNTLLSPEIMARAPAGETRSLRRCFDPPEGWRFDKAQRRVVIVERLGWLDDVGDPTLNGGTVEFAEDEGAAEVCLLVSAKPVTKGARTATIGRFEATLSRGQPQEKTVQSGVRALDWDEPLRLPIEPSAVERRLYVRLFGEIVRELADPLAGGLPFLRISREDDSLVLRVDPAAQP